MQPHARAARPTGSAADYAAALIASVAGRVAGTPEGRSPHPDIHPDIEWAQSGAMALTGTRDGPPRLAPGPLATCARGAAEALALLAGERWRAPLDGPALLGERAAISGLRRQGTTSPSGSCRLLRAADAWIAVNLARPEDVSLLPAWLGEGALSDPWRFVEERVALRPAGEVVARARLLGLPAAVAADPPEVAPPWCRIAARGTPAPRRKKDRCAPFVVDLSSLWAGPLCAQLLGLAGARVAKVESTRRPDGARAGPPAFFDLLNGGKASVALDFGSDAGREQLGRLVERADIVVESSRPRALAQLGIDAEALVETIPGLTWLSITGYGRSEPGAGWVAFGDDAGAAAGLAAATGPADGPPVFCGDAIADPLTGLHAAVAALASWNEGGGKLLDLALCNVAAHALAFDTGAEAACVRRTGSEDERRTGRTDTRWEVVAGSARAGIAAPRARPVESAARPLGSDTQALLAELGIRC